MGLRRAIPSAAGVGAVLLCASGAAAQATTSVCMDGRMATSISQYRVGSLEYEMLMINYKMGVADSLNIPGCNQAACPGVVVKGKIPPRPRLLCLVSLLTLGMPDAVPPDCTPPPPPAPTRPVVTRPGMPPPPPPPPPPPAQAGSESVQGSFALAVSPEYAAAICQHGSEEQRTMIESVQEQTAARLSEQAGCNSRTRIFVDNKWEVTCGVCRDTCFQADSVQIDPSMFGWCAPSWPPSPPRAPADDVRLCACVLQRASGRPAGHERAVLDSVGRIRRDALRGAGFPGLRQDQH